MAPSGAHVARSVCMRQSVEDPSASGITVLEALIAMSIVLVAAGTLLQLAGSAVRTNLDARTSTLATVLAAEKLEQLSALAWTVHGAAHGPSPAGTLDQNTEGFVEFFNARGTMVPEAGSGSGSVLVRRWSLRPLPEDPRCLVLQVVVLPTSDIAQGAGRGSNGRRVHLVTIRTRRVV
jgi:type II secretory pathway pseudopilin PulG